MAAVTLGSWDALGGNPTATNQAVIVYVNNTPFLSFASGTTITSFFIGVIPQGANFSTNGVKVRIFGGSHTATSGVAVLGAAYERLGQLTVASDHYGTQATTNYTVSGTVDTWDNANPALISIPYANMASSVAGDMFRLQIQRVTGGSDTLVGAFQLFGVSMEQV